MGAAQIGNLGMQMSAGILARGARGAERNRARCACFAGRDAHGPQAWMPALHLIAIASVAAVAASRQNVSCQFPKASP
jgi:hypothetical protein